MHDLILLFREEKSEATPLGLEDLPPSIPLYFSRTRPNVDLVKFFNELPKGKSVVTAFHGLMVSDAGIANAVKVGAGNGSYTGLAEIRQLKHSAKTKMSEHVRSNVPGKPIVVRVKCRKCGRPESEKDDDWPSWHIGTGTYVIQDYGSCPNCCFSYTPLDGGREKESIYQRVRPTPKDMQTDTYANKYT